MHADKCGSTPGLCAEMDPYDGKALRSYLLNVNFTGKLMTLYEGIESRFTV